MSVLRLFARYRWELLLFFGIPAAAWFAGNMVLVLSDFLQLPLVNNTNVVVVGRWVESAVSIALLGISYLYVRRQERWLLSLIWRYLLAVEAISLPLIIIWAAWYSTSGVLGILEWFWSTGISLWFWSIGISLFVVALGLPVHLWFARRASRASLAHAFFLVLVVGLVAGGANPAESFFRTWIDELSSSVLAGGLVLALASFTLHIAAGFLGVWLLGSFERRGAVFRRRAIYGLLAFKGYQWLHPGLVVMAVFGWSALTRLDDWLIWRAFLSSFGIDAAIIALTLALVYLVRVRQPSPQGEGT